MEPFPGGELPTTALRDLRPGPVPVAILARIVRADRRMLPPGADGRPRPVLAGLLRDGTATVRFTWWDPPPDPPAPGRLLRAAPVSVREYLGRPVLWFGTRTRVVPAGAAALHPERPDGGPGRPPGEPNIDGGPPPPVLRSAAGEPEPSASVSVPPASPPASPPPIPPTIPPPGPPPSSRRELLLDLVDELLERSGDGRVDVATLLDRAARIGLGPVAAEEVLNGLEEEGILEEPSVGKVRRA